MQARSCEINVYQNLLKELYKVQNCNVCGKIFNLVGSLGHNSICKSSCVVHPNNLHLQTKDGIPSCYSDIKCTRRGCLKISHIDHFSKSGYTTYSRHDGIDLGLNQNILFSYKNPHLKDPCKYTRRDLYTLECGIVILPIFLLNHIMRAQKNKMYGIMQSGTDPNMNEGFVQYNHAETDLFGDANDNTIKLQDINQDGIKSQSVPTLQETLNYFFSNCPEKYDKSVCGSYSLFLDQNEFIEKVAKNDLVHLKEGHFEIALDLFGCYNTILAYSALPCFKSKAQMLSKCPQNQTFCRDTEQGLMNSYFMSKYDKKTNKRSFNVAFRDETSDTVNANFGVNSKNVSLTEDSQIRGEEESEISDETKVIRDLMGYNDEDSTDETEDLSGKHTPLSTSTDNRATKKQKMETPQTYHSYIQKGDSGNPSRKDNTSTKNTTEIDPYYSLMKDIEGVTKYKNGVNSFRYRHFDGTHHPLSSDVDSMPATDSTRYMQYLESKHIVQGYDMHQNELKETCLTADGITKSDIFLRSKPFVYEKVYNNAQSKLYENSYNSSSLGDVSERYLKPYQDQINDRMLNREIKETGNYYTKTKTRSNSCGIFRDWDIDDFGFIPFIVFINGIST